MEINDIHLSTSDKIMLAAIDLMAEKGYKGVSTKEIAAVAGVSEMTLFRHFGSKKNLLETAVDRFHYSVEMKKLFSQNLVWDLEEDLLLISKSYHAIMNRNRKMFLIALKEGNHLSNSYEKMNKHPRQLKELLVKYFTTMQERGKMISTNTEAQAMSFMWMNYGAFISNLVSDVPLTSISMEEFIRTSVQLFARALTP
ncbi:TetR/AcrR family transcriptional regulator [Thermoflavimicrobium daqui]|uniref:TetR/AcrR family transcriptional regulator n=1 Tax=Thermoflavimicrobium daqui TaxID=2137476 RepID=A0A364K489_9BACL|nr:TetR/AcrR family transcriptional regulator [Thermoflavimicrobium daqui]RAL24172.1 TetR/AcrR family transcriptional regulator [Thermoflavimicrobium daqui]